MYDNAEYLLFKDDIGLTLEKEKEIKIFESNRSNIGGIIKNN